MKILKGRPRGHTVRWVERKQKEAREVGFHEGVMFAIEVIGSALVKNTDIPMLAFQAAKEVLLKKGPQ